MLTSKQRILLIEFIKNDLGCNCPEEVFRNLEVLKSVKISDSFSVSFLIKVGGRLLIAILDKGIADCDEAGISKLLVQLKKRRDFEGFNRLRIVLSDPDDKNFNRFFSLKSSDKLHLDDNIHIHRLKNAEKRLSFLL